MEKFTKSYLHHLHSLFLGLLFFLSVFLCSFKANAQATATCGGVVSFMPLNTCATNVAISDPTNDYPALPAAACLNGGTFRREGWLGFTVPAGPNQNVTITATLASTTQNLGIEAFSACNAANIINCANAIPVGTASCEALALPNLAPGNYYFRLLNLLAGGSNITVAKLCVNTTPVNNDCSGAITLTPAAPSAACSNYTATTAGATQSLPANLGCSSTAANSANDDVWFTFFATSTTHVITVTPSVNFNAVFEVYTSSCGGTSINCTNVNNSGGQPETSTLTGLSIGTQYWIRVFDNGSNASGIPLTSTFDICIQTPPANDDCLNAVLLTPSASCVGVIGNVGVASNSGIAVSTSCSTSNPDDDVWYTFTATGTSHTITVNGSASFDPGFEVFTGSCAGLTSVLCNAPGGQTGLSVSSILATSIGTVYYVRVYDYGIAYPGTTDFTICILNPPPANDDCSGAIALTPLSATCALGANEQTGNVSGATQSFVGCTGNANDDVWYSFTTNATAAQAYVITVTGSASFDPVFQVYSTSCGGTSVNCTNANATLGGTETTTLTGLSVSTTYWVRVYDANSTYPATTTFDICITLPPLNDACPGSTLGVFGNLTTPAICGVTTSGTLLGASASGFLATCGGTASRDVFYNFVATSTSHIVTITPCANLDAVIQVYSGSCGGTSINCTNALGAGGIETAYLTSLTVGLTYWVRVYDFNGTSACSTFTICVTTPPVNDLCASATTLTPATSCAFTSGSLLNGTVSFPANCGGTITSDVWYTFTAGAANQTITVNGAAGINIVYELFSSNPCGGAGTSLGCINLTGAGGNESFAWTGLTGGAQYWVRVYDFSGAPTTFAFAICIVTPSNDLCANASTAVCGGVYNGCTSVACGMTGTGDPTALCVAQTAPSQGVWYVYAGSGQNVILTTCGGTTNFDTQLFVYTGTCGSLTCLMGNDDMCNPSCVGGVTCGYPQASRLTFGTLVGTNYYIFVSGWAGATGNFTLTVTCATPPVNDQCAGAILTACGTTLTGSTITATNNNDITNCGSATATSPVALWYNYAGDGSTLIISTCGGTTNYNTQLGVWSATSCAGPFTCIAGNDDTGGCTGSAAGNGSSVTFTTAVGINYYIEVYGFFTAVATGPQTGNFTLGVAAGAGGCVILPISLLNFMAEPQGSRNTIKWETASEINNDYFTVERSDDGLGFLTLAKVNGAGNSTSLIDYQTYDEHPNNGITYYRLKQTDYNSAYTYSSIISVDNAMNPISLFNVHPNPTSNDINFDFHSSQKGRVHIEILDYLGRIVDNEMQTVQDGNSPLTAKMNTLAPGIYSLKVSFDQSGFVSVTKVVRN